MYRLSWVKYYFTTKNKTKQLTAALISANLDKTIHAALSFSDWKLLDFP